jgi:hypothetical protein
MSVSAAIVAGVDAPPVFERLVPESDTSYSQLPIPFADYWAKRGLIEKNTVHLSSVAITNRFDLVEDDCSQRNGPSVATITFSYASTCDPQSTQLMIGMVG